MTTQTLADHRVIAFNTSHASDNKIHDDTVAKRLGFSGGLVPGVDVYAYMTHAPMSHWGLDWLRHGYMEVRLLKPVYDGAETLVRAALDPAGAMAVSAHSGDQVCADGLARLDPSDVPDTAATAFDRAPLPAYDDRPPADDETLRPGRAMGTIDEDPIGAFQEQYLVDVREDLTIFSEHDIVHPGLLLRRANMALRDNVRLGPWIHVSSKIWHLRPLGLDEPFTTRARVTRNYDRKGHLYVDLDVVIAANDREPVCRIDHSSIYVPRQLRDAA